MEDFKTPRSIILRRIAYAFVGLAIIASTVSLALLILNVERIILIISSTCTTSFLLFFGLTYYLTRREQGIEDLEMIKELDAEMKAAEADRQTTGNISYEEFKKNIEEYIQDKTNKEDK